MKHELRNLSFISDELDNGNICPACPKVCAININSNINNVRMVAKELYL